MSVFFFFLPLLFFIPHGCKIQRFFESHGGKILGVFNFHGGEILGLKNPTDVRKKIGGPEGGSVGKIIFVIGALRR